MSAPDAGPTPPAARALRWTVYGLAVGGGGLVVLSGIFPSAPFTALAVALSAAPLALWLWAPELFVNMVRPRRGGTPRPGLNPIAGIPALALFFRAVGMDMIDVIPSWIAAGACAALLAAAAQLRRPVRTPIQLLLYATLFGLALGYGAATQGNVRFDASAGDTYRATVIDAMISRSVRSTTYSVKLSPWGPNTGANWQDVPSSIYSAVGPGDALCPTLHPGALGERWFTIDLCAPPNGAPP
jgi:hypothetical protein